MTFSIRARLHNARAKGNAAFVVLRDQINTLQACGFVNQTPNFTKDFVKFINQIPKESIVDVSGSLQESKVESCSITDYEFHIESL